jgi:hypothetical protein
MGENANAFRKKSGFPLVEDYISPIVVQQFSTISLLLQGNNITSNDDIFNVSYNLKYCNENSLSMIVYRIQMFMEEQLGRNSQPENRETLTKLPIQVFRNYSAYSSLHIILKLSIDLQISNGWKEFDINTIDRIKNGFKLLKDIETKLIEYGMLSRPKIYLNKVPASIEQTLRKIVNDHAGSIVNAPNLATHLIDWDEEVDNFPADLSEEFIRTIDFRPELDGGIALVHWWYFPDCYDEWISAQDVKDNDPPDTNPLIDKDKKWRVCCRFIYDCQKFNEWGNEIDYILENEDDLYDEDELENTPVKGVTRGKRGRKRKDAVETAPKVKKQTIIPESIISTEKMMRYYQAPTLQNKRMNFSFVDISLGTPCEYSIVPNTNFQQIETKETEEEQAPIDPDYDKKKARRAKKAAAILQQSDLPEWFEVDKINDLEKNYLSFDLFKGLSGPLLEKKEREYLRIRNFIIFMYAQNPTAFLSATDCRHKIAGNVCDIVKIHDFLNAFGAINFLMKPELRPIGRFNFSPAQLNFKLLSEITACSDDVISHNIYKVMHKHDSNPFNNLTTDNKKEEINQFIKAPDLTSQENLKKFLQFPISSMKKESMNEMNVPAFYHSMSKGFLSDKMKAMGHIITSNNNECGTDLKESITQSLNLLHKSPIQSKIAETDQSLEDEISYLEKKLELLVETEKSLDLEKIRIGHDRVDLSQKRLIKTFQQKTKLTFL